MTLEGEGRERTPEAKTPTKMIHNESRGGRMVAQWDLRLFSVLETNRIRIVVFVGLSQMLGNSNKSTEIPFHL